MKSVMELVFENMREGRPITPEMLARALDEISRIKRVVHAARETRKAQEKYYRHGRTQSALKESKGWEKELDKALAELWVKPMSENTQQGRLL